MQKKFVQLNLECLESRDAAAAMGLTALADVPTTVHVALPRPPLLGWDPCHADACSEISVDPYAVYWVEEVPNIEVLDYIARMRDLGYRATSPLSFDVISGEIH